jgi:hypothetical protein
MIRGPNFKGLFQQKNCVLILAKMDWAPIWAIFTQHHLVTLTVDKKFIELFMTNQESRK